MTVMQTQVMDDRVVGVPWLETYPVEGGPPKRHELRVFPFKIGRVETADLRIDDPRVSREHAVVLREGNTFLVHDLGSTNGTILNGRRVREAPLSDGDILVIADVEFGFNCGQPSAQSTATQVMASGDAGSQRDAWEVVRAVRRVHEMLAQRCVEHRFQPIADLTSGAVMGYAALAHEDDPLAQRSSAERSLMGNAGRLGGRLRRLSRMVAVESARRLPDGCRVFLQLDPSELGSESLAESLSALVDVVEGPQRLVIEMAESVVGDLPYYHELIRELHEQGLAVAYDGFAGGKAQLLEKRQIPPDFLKLAPSVVQGLNDHPERHEQLKKVSDVAREMGCQIIAEGVETEVEAAICRELGCTFGQGPCFGSPQPISAVAMSPRAKESEPALVKQR